MDIVKYIQNKRLNDILIKSLTKRELEILRLLARGNSLEAAAKELIISRNTAKSHVQNISQKIKIDKKTIDFRTMLCIFYFKYKWELEHGRN